MLKNDGEQALLRAETLLARRELAEADACFHAAEAAGSDADRCAAGRWMVAMLLGDFAAAWQESDAIRKRDGMDVHRLWNGAPLEGKRVIVRCLHGLGDAVQMLRYLPQLSALCSRVIVEVPPRLLPLAPFFVGMQKVITWGEQAPAQQPAWDIQVEVMELPFIFRSTKDTLQMSAAYLAVPAGKVRDMARKMGRSDTPRVGLVWSASEWDPSRCLPADCVERLLAEPGIQFWNLQGGVQHASGLQAEVASKICDAAIQGDGVLSLACILANLDLVITVDTLAAHLAGALGRPAWVLLQQRADWRWMHGRDRSPWYSSLRLWRQHTQDDWATLTTEVCEALRCWVQRAQRP